MINENNYKRILKVGILDNQTLVKYFGSSINKATYKQKNKVNNSMKSTLLGRASQYCNIKDIGDGKYKITKILPTPKLIENISSHPLYQTYYGMRDRCYNKNTQAYPNYGGRGITICNEWLNKKDGLTNFIKWSESNGYKPNKGKALTIDRIDNDKGYSPDNCRWTTWDVQIANRRVSKKNQSRHIKEINGLFLTHLYFENVLYPVGTFNTLDEAKENQNNLLLKIQNKKENCNGHKED